MDDYADRVYVPGQPAAVPQRDVEPFWPPDEIVPEPVEFVPSAGLPHQEDQPSAADQRPNPPVQPPFAPPATTPPGLATAGPAHPAPGPGGGYPGIPGADLLPGSGAPGFPA
ncbi:MAG TPA: hypothetical protein VGD43_02255, partial [Micromonospora sp.]